MDAAELALIELLDHLGRQASYLKVPAPRKGDSVAHWCSSSAGAEACLKAYLTKQYPARAKEFEALGQKEVSFETLMRELRRAP